MHTVLALPASRSEDVMSSEEIHTTDYVRAASFRREVSAKAAYYRIQELLRNRADDCSFSVYNSLLNGVRVVTVIGNTPPVDVQNQIQSALSKGTEFQLPDDVRVVLGARSLETRRRTIWAEGHYGKGVRPEHEE